MGFISTLQNSIPAVTSRDFPALYRAASVASAEAQKAYFNSTKTYGAVSLVGTAIAIYSPPSVLTAIAAATMFAAGLSLSVLMALRRYERSWYSARAVAESVKTASWRYAMRAEPYAGEPDSLEDRKVFASVLRKILDEHKSLAHELAKDASGAQITEKMDFIRRLPLVERKQVYELRRIDDQRAWYESGARKNRKHGRAWFAVFAMFQAAAIFFTILKVAYPNSQYLPTAVFAMGATIVFGWMSIKRYRELAAAYAVAAHEIGIAATELVGVVDDRSFSQFVGDTENAFSREHTQWIARKDT